jgi:hypothetical protein
VTVGWPREPNVKGEHEKPKTVLAEDAFQFPTEEKMTLNNT